MLGIIGIIAVLTVLGLSLLVTRIAAIALSLTGLSREVSTVRSTRFWLVANCRCMPVFPFDSYLGPV
jgi:hypothetical protein